MATAKKTQPKVELKALDEQQLVQKIAELKKELVEQHRANAAQELPSPVAIRKTRRTIATALTILGQKRREAAKETK